MLEPPHHGFLSLALLLCVLDGSSSALNSYLTLTGAEVVGTYLRAWITPSHTASVTTGLFGENPLWMH